MNYFDLEPYVEDDWKARPNMTISGGLRFETQDHIHDHADFAPRVGIAWGLGKGKSTKTVLRAGFGVFYDRFGESYILNAERLNGINQQQYIVALTPNFFPRTFRPSARSPQAWLRPRSIKLIPICARPTPLSQGWGWSGNLPKTPRSP